MYKNCSEFEYGKTKSPSVWKGCVLLLIVFDVLNDVADGLDAFKSVVGDFKSEFILEGHNKVNNVQGVCAEIIGDDRVQRNFVQVDG